MKKGFSKRFWNHIVPLILLNIFSHSLEANPPTQDPEGYIFFYIIILLINLGVLISYMNLFLVAGKIAKLKYRWLLVWIALFPIGGIWIIFFIARHYLKDTKYWVLKENKE